jgi:hypothetical protein
MMRVWLLRGKDEDAARRLDAALRQWAARPPFAAWLVTAAPDGPADDAEPPDVVVCPADRPPTETVLARAPGVVISGADLDAFVSLGERHAVILVPAAPTAECLGLAVLSAAAAARRQRAWQERLADAQARLADRIVVERAKGLLVCRLGISEEEAYHRLRAQSRRQRRPLRDVARSLLDSEHLLLPGPAADG